MIDDPRLTAFVLGELDPPEQAEIEQLLTTDPEAAREVAEMRSFTTLMRSELASEEAPALGAAQKEEILATAQAAALVSPVVSRKFDTDVEASGSPTADWRRVWIPAAVAACAAVAAGYSALFYNVSVPVAKPRVAQEKETLGRFHVALQQDEEKPGLASTPDAPASAADALGAAPAPATPAFGRREDLLVKRMLTADDAQAAGRGERESRSLGLAFETKSAQSPSEVQGNKPAQREEGVRLKSEIAIRRKFGAPDENFALAPTGATAPLSSATSPAKPEGEPAAQAAGGMRGALLARAGRVDGGPGDFPAPVTAAPLPVGATVSTITTTNDAFYANESRMAGGRTVRDGALGDNRLFAEKGRESALEERVAAYDKESRSDPVTGPASRESELASGLPALKQAEPSNTESYDTITDNPFLAVRGNELSTFAIDVDTASYANVRRFLTAGQRPPKGAVRIEELINYFSYAYPEPKEGEPVSVNMEVAACPWAPEHRLLRVGLKARDIAPEKRPEANLVFLIDVSGSMEPANRLPLVKESLRLLVDKLAPRDTVAIAVYAGASGTILEPTSDKSKIREALDHLEAGGSTNGAAGIRLAYDLAQKAFSKEKTNRVILSTDGDFNVGVTNQSELVELIQKKAKSGVFLTVLGFGYGNLKDSTMEKLADKGHGNYAYIDTLAEGRKVLVEQMAGTLHTVAKDVKMQIEFNPAQVSGYRLMGYENRLLAKEDFNDDKKDGGDMGAGHTVTALYELVPATLGRETTKVDVLKYQPQPAAPESKPVDERRYSAALPPPDSSRGRRAAIVAGGAPAPATAADAGPLPAGAKADIAQRIAVERDSRAPESDELLTVKLRWKAPTGDQSVKGEFPLTDSGLTWEKSSRDFRWAAAVAGFGMMLRDSPHKGQANWSSIRELAVEGKGEDASGYRREFIGLIDKAAALPK